MRFIILTLALMAMFSTASGGPCLLDINASSMQDFDAIVRQGCDPIQLMQQRRLGRARVGNTADAASNANNANMDIFGDNEGIMDDDNYFGLGGLGGGLGGLGGLGGGLGGLGGLGGGLGGLGFGGLGGLTGGLPTASSTVGNGGLHPLVAAAMMGGDGDFGDLGDLGENMAIASLLNPSGTAQGTLNPYTALALADGITLRKPRVKNTQKNDSPDFLDYALLSGLVNSGNLNAVINSNPYAAALLTNSMEDMQQTRALSTIVSALTSGTTVNAQQLQVAAALADAMRLQKANHAMKRHQLRRARVQRDGVEPEDVMMAQAMGLPATAAFFMDEMDDGLGLLAAGGLNLASGTVGATGLNPLLMGDPGDMMKNAATMSLFNGATTGTTTGLSPAALMGMGMEDAWKMRGLNSLMTNTAVAAGNTVGSPAPASSSVYSALLDLEDAAEDRVKQQQFQALTGQGNSLASMASLLLDDDITERTAMGNILAGKRLRAPRRVRAQATGNTEQHTKDFDGLEDALELGLLTGGVPNPSIMNMALMGDLVDSDFAEGLVQAQLVSSLVNGAGSAAPVNNLVSALVRANAMDEITLRKPRKVQNRKLVPVYRKIKQTKTTQ